MNVIEMHRTVELASKITEVSRGYRRDELVHAIDLILQGISQSDVYKGRKHTAYEEIGEIWE